MPSKFFLNVNMNSLNLNTHWEVGNYFQFTDREMKAESVSDFAQEHMLHLLPKLHPSLKHAHHISDHEALNHYLCSKSHSNVNSV